MNKLTPYLKPAPCEYHDEDHTYTSKEDGKLWPGVTSITENLNKPYLASWAAKMMWAEMTGKRKELAKMTDKEYEAFILEAKSAHRKKKEEAADSGTLAHEYIENYINKTKLAEERVKKIKADVNAMSAIRQFLKWEKSERVEWLASDTVVGSQMHEFGGRLDAIANINSILTLVDFKTSNQISQEYFLQTAGYQIALEEMGLVPLQRYILRIPKDGNEFEVCTVKTPYELDSMGFLALRQVQRVLSYYNNLNHEVKDENGKVKVDKRVEKTKPKK